MGITLWGIVSCFCFLTQKLSSEFAGGSLATRPVHSSGVVELGSQPLTPKQSEPLEGTLGFLKSLDTGAHGGKVMLKVIEQAAGMAKRRVTFLHSTVLP